MTRSACLLALGLFAAGCDTRADLPDPAAFPSGSQWVLAALDGAPAPQFANARLFTARFGQGRITGASACNDYTGRYTADRAVAPSPRIDVRALHVTDQPCSDERLAAERRFFEVLGGVTSWERTDDLSLHLSGPGGNLVFEPLYVAFEY